LINRKFLLINDKSGRAGLDPSNFRPLTSPTGREGVMGTCSYCGSRFPLTRATRKYCTPRCKTNACLDRKPSRLRAADVRALYDLLDSGAGDVEVLRERLRRIIAPQRPPITTAEPGNGYVPSMD
jgi:hypothetical protein